MHSYAKRFRYFAVMALSFCAHNAFAQWEQITPENEVVVSVPGGGEKTVYPSCSLKCRANQLAIIISRGETTVNGAPPSTDDYVARHL